MFLFHVHFQSPLYYKHAFLFFYFCWIPQGFFSLTDWDITQCCQLIFIIASYITYTWYELRNPKLVQVFFVLGVPLQMCLWSRFISCWFFVRMLEKVWFRCYTYPLQSTLQFRQPSLYPPSTTPRRLKWILWGRNYKHHRVVFYTTSRLGCE